MPFFSVIIPLYNKEAYVADTLNSVLNQSFQDFEVIIVDDGSTDGSIDIVSRFQDYRIKIFEQENQGVSVARNHAIENAESKYIALLDADDIWHKNHLNELKKLIRKFPNAGLFCTNYQIKLSNNLIIPTVFNFTYNEQCSTIKDFFSANTISLIALTSSVSFLKSNFKKIGGFNKCFKTGQDIDLWIRFALEFNVAFNPKVTMTYNNFDKFSLSKSNYNNQRYKLINSYLKEEKLNKSLKIYLDINRYALAIRCILNNETDLYKKLKKEINYKNLNFKQKVLISLPKGILKQFKKIQKYLIRNKIYLSAYR